MSNFVVCLNAVLPTFIMIVMGYIARVTGIIKRNDVSRFNRVIFIAFLPFLSFRSVYHSGGILSLHGGFLLFAVCTVLVVYALATIGVLLLEKDINDRSVLIQGLYRTNFVLFGLPLATKLLPTGSIGDVAMLIAITVPMYNVLAVITLEVYQGGTISLRATLLSIILNPIIIGVSSGIFFSALKIDLPSVLDGLLDDLADVTTPMLLFLLGSFFDFSGLKKYRRKLFWVSMLRLMIIPGIVLTVAMYMGFRGTQFVALLSCFAAPTATGSFSMVQQIGGNEELAGDIVVTTNALCVLTIFLWSLIFKSLGLF